ncbi:MAG: hypothetical protein R3F55_22445 [Alphaproteobacteria bacterium]
MMSRHLIQRLPTMDGSAYVAGEPAAPFLASLSTIYKAISRTRNVGGRTVPQRADSRSHSHHSPSI